MTSCPTLPQDRNDATDSTEPVLSRFEAALLETAGDRRNGTSCCASDAPDGDAAVATGTGASTSQLAADAAEPELFLRLEVAERTAFVDFVLLKSAAFVGTDDLAFFVPRLPLVGLTPASALAPDAALTDSVLLPNLRTGSLLGPDSGAEKLKSNSSSKSCVTAAAIALSAATRVAELTV